MTSQLRLGMLTPSSNTVLEPITAAILAGLPGVTSHASRFKVTEIALNRAALGQFDETPILRATELLVDARVDVIAWNGTSASWLGIDRDRRLVEQIQAATGIPAVTCVLGLLDLIQRFGAENGLGLATPYLDDVQARIGEVYAAEGVRIRAERHLGLSDNFSFATVSEKQIDRMARDLVAEGCEAVAVLCTNMQGARAAARVERETDVLQLDSVAVTLWACLDRLGVDMTPLRPWGRMFEAVMPQARFKPHG